jgi:hypothetical protein
MRRTVLFIKADYNRYEKIRVHVQVGSFPTDDLIYTESTLIFK